MNKDRLKSIFYKIRILSLFILPLTAACSHLAEDHPTGVWLGKLETQQGTCPNDRMAALRIGKKKILFSPDNGALVLTGVYHKKEHPRHLVAVLHRTDMNHKPYDLIFEGKAKDRNLIGTYGTPDCRATITFYRPQHYGLSNAIAH